MPHPLSLTHRYGHCTPSVLHPYCHRRRHTSHTCWHRCTTSKVHTILNSLPAIALYSSPKCTCLPNTRQTSTCPQELGQPQQMLFVHYTHTHSHGLPKYSLSTPKPEHRDTIILTPHSRAPPSSIPRPIRYPEPHGLPPLSHYKATRHLGLLFSSVRR